LTRRAGRYSDNVNGGYFVVTIAPYAEARRAMRIAPRFRLKIPSEP
jgi:hypothetical protein